MDFVKRRILAAVTLLLLVMPHLSLGQDLIPDFVVSQVSGSLGTYSSGFGYYVLNNRARVSGHCGIVHEGKRINLSVASIKAFYSPLTVTAWNRIKVSPADIGIIASYVAGSAVLENTNEISKTRKAWWHTGFGVHVALENCVTYEFKKEQLFRSITGYLEVNTNERYFIDFIRNTKDTSIGEILRFGTGVRLTF